MRARYQALFFAARDLPIHHRAYYAKAVVGNIRVGRVGERNGGGVHGNAHREGCTTYRLRLQRARA
jgi:hypothetical protein